MLFVFLACCPAPALAAAPTLDWDVPYTRSFGGHEVWVGGAVDAAGNSVVLYSDNALTYRKATWDSTGALVSDIVLPDLAGSMTAVALDGSGNLVVAGTRVNGSTGRTEVMAAVFTAAGALSWEATHDTGFDSTVHGVTADAAGSVLVAGYHAGVTNEDAVMVKFDSGGTYQWTGTADFGDDDEGYAVAADGAGNSYLVGSALTAGVWSAFAAKFDPTGASGGSNTYSVLPNNYARAAAYSGGFLYIAADDYASVAVLQVSPAAMTLFNSGSRAATLEMNIPGGIAVDGTGRPTVAGLHWDIMGGGNYDLGVIAFTSALTTAWTRTHDGGGWDALGVPVGAARAGCDAAGNVYVNAMVTPAGCDLAPQDVFVRAYSSAGAELWTRQHDLAPVYDIAGVATDGTGNSYLGMDTIFDAEVVAFDGMGGVQWAQVPSWSGYCNTGAGGFASSAGSLYISVGVYDSAGFANEVRVARYDTGGTQTGSFTFDQIAGVESGPVVADAAGNLYLAGSYYSSALEYDFFVAKYDAAGAVQWSRSYTVAVDDVPSGIALDGTGGVVVVEDWPRVGDGSEAAAVIRLDAATGALSWTRTVGGAPGELCGAASVATLNGVVYVVGGCKDPGGAQDGRIWKLDPAGTVVWTRTFDGGQDASFEAVAADPASGPDCHVDVTGITGTYATPSTWDIATVSYDPEGRERWTTTFDSAGASDAGYAVAAGSVYVGGRSDKEARLVRYTEPANAWLSASAAVTPSWALPGEWAEVVLTVTNTGTADAVNVTPLIDITSGAANLNLEAGPVPPGPVTIGAGLSQSFTWTYSASGGVSARFTVTAVGDDSSLGIPVLAAATAALEKIVPCSDGLVIRANVPSPVYANGGEVQTFGFGFSLAGSTTVYNVTFTTQPDSFQERIYVGLSQTVVLNGGMTQTASWATSQGGPWTTGQPPSATGDPVYLRWVIPAVYPGRSGSITWQTTLLSGPMQTVRSYVAATLSCDSGGTIPAEPYMTATTTGQRVGTPVSWLALWGSPSASFSGVAASASGSIYVAGVEQGQGSRWSIRKYGPGGALVWNTSYHSPVAVGSDSAAAVALDSLDRAVVAGTEQRTDLGQGNNWVVSVFTADGALAWSRSYNSPGNGNEAANAVAVSPSGRYVVAGYEDRADLGEGLNWRIAVYGSAGVLLASTTYDSPGHGADEARGVAVDSAGNIIVVGYEDRSDLGEGLNWRVTKYDSALNLVWTRTLNGPAGGSDEARAVAVDPGDSVIVAGYETSIAAGTDIRAVKYDPSGNLVWTFSYDSPASDADVANGVSVDAGGSVVVAGYENRADLGQDGNWRVIKLDNAGNVLDSFSHDGVASGGDGLGAVAVIPRTQDVGVAGGEALADGNPNAAAARIALASFSPPRPAAGVTALAAGAAINIAWSPAAAGTRAVSGYRVYRATTSSVSITADTWYADVTGAASASFIDTGVTNGLNYRYKIIPVDDQGASATSSITANAMLAAAFLTAALTVTPEQAIPGQAVSVRCRVRNTGLAPAELVYPEIEINTNALSVTLFAGPSPSGTVVIAAGGSRNFFWTYSVTGYGLVTFTATATGIDTGLGGALAASDSATLLVAAVAILDAALEFPAASSTVLVGQWFTVTMTITNTGSLEARNLVPSVVYSPGGALELQSGPPALFNMPIGSSTVLSWTYSVSGYGVMLMTVSVTGDDGAGGMASAGGTGSCILARDAILIGNISVAPTIIATGQMFTVRVTITNTGDMPLTGVDVDPVPTVIPWSGTLAVTLASGPEPLGPQLIHGHTATAFVWTYSTSGDGIVYVQVPVVALMSGYGVPFSGAAADYVCVVPRGDMSVSMSATPLVVPQGGTILVTMTVSNTGATAIWNVSPDAALRISVTTTGLSATTIAAGTGGPAPATALTVDPCPIVGCGIDQDACPPRTFTWTVTALASGSVSFSASVWWMESISPFMGSTAYAVSNDVFVMSAPLLSARAEVSAASLKYGTPFTFRLTVSNTGGVSVWDLVPALSVSDTHVARVDQAPSLAGATIDGGTSKTWVWQMTALNGGQLKLTGSFGGLYWDLSSTTMIGGSSSATLAVSSRPSGEIAVYPNPAAADVATLYLALAEDAAEVVVDAYDSAMHRVYTGTWRNVPWIDGNLTIAGIRRWAPGLYLIRARVTYMNGVTRVFPVFKFRVQR